MKTVKIAIYSLIYVLIANSFVFLEKQPKIIFIVVPLFFIVNMFAGVFTFKTNSKRLRICYHGAVLLIMAFVSIWISILCNVIMLLGIVHVNTMTFVLNLLICIIAESLLFWNGIICVYCTSVQLGIRTRVIGILCGLIPVVNLITIAMIISIVLEEIDTEVKKEKMNEERKEQRICATKYPILMVHGVFFRDYKHLNYWGRIPNELEKNGAVIYYGNHQSALSVADSAEELACRIKQIIEDTGCEKVNIIAHSKGGLDCRYAISKLDIAPYVASLTTINTPHRGCMFVDYLLKNLGKRVKNRIASMYNSALIKCGDDNPDFLVAVNDLQGNVCMELDLDMEMPEGIYCQSVGSILNKARGGKFPHNFSYKFVKKFDGPNDGLVGEESFRWGEKYTLVTTTGKRGISHGDMVDMNRENFKEFDVREFYVQLVNDLKERGM